MTVIEYIKASGLEVATSNARRLVLQGGVWIQWPGGQVEPVTDMDMILDPVRYAGKMLRVGRLKRALIEF